MPDKATDKLIFIAVVIYLPLSIFFIFWLYLLTLIYAPDTWQHKLFHGQDGNYALLWLLGILLPALIALLRKARGRVLLTRAFGAIGFFCLLGSLLSSHGWLALPGFVCLVISIVINRKLKKLARENRKNWKNRGQSL